MLIGDCKFIFHIDRKVKLARGLQSISLFMSFTSFLMLSVSFCSCHLVLLYILMLSVLICPYLLPLSECCPVCVTVPDDEDCRELTAGLGLDEISEDSAGPARYQKSSFNKDSHMASVHNHALIQYFARLGQSKREDETIDLEVVHSLLRSGADINCTDRHGQTILHEVNSPSLL